jgi:hypothetical protein
LKNPALLIAVLFAHPLMAAPPALPEYVQSCFDAATLDYELPLGKFETYLKSYFDQENQVEPWAIVGDFNGDKITDWAGLLRDNTGRIDLVVVYSMNGEYSHEVLSSVGADEDGIYFGVVLEPPGEIHGFPIDEKEPDPVVSLSDPGIHLFYYEKSSVLYYWQDGLFSELWTSD